MLNQLTKISPLDFRTINKLTNINFIKITNYEKFIKIIGEKRTLKLLSLEHEFRRVLLERLKDRREGGPQDRKPHGGKP